MIVGDPLHPKTRTGSLVSQEQLDRVLSYIEKGKNEGANILVGGERVGVEGFYLQPTIFDNVNNNMTIAQEEIFGPVASVITFDGIDEAIKIANDSSFGLAAGVWTNDIKKAIRFAKSVKAGSIWVNTYNMTDNALPFGGFKESGIGREMGKAAMDIYTETKTVWIDLN
jgi:acyl-CoA reductase-like NAD-dependent aldehyde dehydrogenase